MKNPVLTRSWIVLCLFAVLAAHAGGPDPTEGKPPNGGDCYAAYPYSVNENQARVKAEKGWYVMPLQDRYHISRLTADGKAEVLLVQDHRVCGPVLGEMKQYATWYYRMKKE